MIRRYRSLSSLLSSATFSTALASLSLIFATFFFTSTAHAQSAGGWNRRGQAAELREDYDAAYEDYLKAHLKSPKDIRYTTRLDRMRFQAAAQHVDRGRILRQSGDIAGALNQFTRALEIDPSNEAAAQEIQITKAQDTTGSNAPASPSGLARATTISHEIASVSGPLILKPLATEPITLHTIEDAKNIYVAIGELAGINVLFDPDFHPSRIPIDLKSLTLDEALRVLAIESKSFYKVVTPDTIYVAENSPTKHKDLDEVAVQTFYLTNAAEQAASNEVVTTLRQVLAPEDRVLLVQSQDAIVVRAPIDHLLLAEKVINDLDRSKAEVVVDVAILEVNRDKVRNLGLTLPQSIGITPQETPTSTNTTTTTTTGSTAQASNFTLNTLANINSTNFSIQLTGGTLNALLTDADTRVLQEPSVRATDGQTAKLKIGSKIPIATGSFSGGTTGSVAGLGLGVQTQFTYLDVGVNIEMLPTVHLDRDVGLKLTVESSEQTGSVTVSPGVTQPIIGQRSDSTTIQLHDGEPTLLAGFLSRTDSSNTSGTPGLSQIPLLKYIFGSVYHENAQDEVVFVLIPHVVRESVLTGLNTRAFDTGTSGDIEIRHGEVNPSDLNPLDTTPPSSNNITAANAASAIAAQIREQSLPPKPPAPATTTPMPATTVPGPATAAPAMTPAAPSANASAAGLPIALSILPANSNQTVGSVFQTSVVIVNGHDVFAVPLNLQYDPRILQLVNVATGGLLGGDGQPVDLVHRDDGKGGVYILASRAPGAGGVNGQGQVFTLTFKAIAAGDSTIALTRVGAINSFKANLPATSAAPAVVHVK